MPEVTDLTCADASDSGWDGFSVAGSTHAIAWREWKVKIYGKADEFNMERA